MKKLILLGAMLAMVLVAVSPALAQIAGEAGLEEVESGGATGSSEVANKGNLVNQCAAILNATQSGNPAAVAALPQYITETDDIEISGSTIAISPELASECNQVIEVKGKEEKKPEVKVEVKAPKVEVKPGEAPKVEVKAEAPKVEVKALPKTGGEASLLALGAGALLVAGGLLVRRIIR